MPKHSLAEAFIATKPHNYQDLDELFTLVTRVDPTAVLFADKGKVWIVFTDYSEYQLEHRP